MGTNTPLSYECVEPAQPAQACVIWLHGLGADGHDFVEVVPALNLPDKPAVRFIFPHAPERPITLNQGMVMRGWYDIFSLERLGGQDERGLLDSKDAVSELIEAQVADGISPANIILAGFSQGGALALYTALTYAQPLGGVIALSTYLPLAYTLKPQTLQTQLPIYMAHGTHDPVLPIVMGQTSKFQLTTLGLTVDWHTFPMAHTVCMEEIEQIGTWLQQQLTESKRKTG